MAQEKEHAQLEWVIVNDERKHVSEFSHLKPDDRPEAICPVCRQPVIMKLGNIKMHHAAHLPDSLCSVTNPETALHFNAKMKLAERLEKDRKYGFLITCDQCGKTRKEWTWIEGVDEVKVEYTLSNVRPDVAALREGQVIAAFEILVTHQVDAEKRRKLDALNVEWVELSPEPGPVVQSNIKWPEYVCDDCLRQNEEQKALWKKLEEEAEHRRLNYEKAFRLKQIHVVMPNGDKLLGCFFLHETVKDGTRQQMDLTFNHFVITSISGDELDNFARDLIQNAVVRHIRCLTIDGCRISADPWRDYDGIIYPKSHENADLKWFDVSKYVEVAEARKRVIEKEKRDFQAKSEAYREYLKEEITLLSGSTTVRCTICGQDTKDWYEIDGKPETAKCRKCVLGQ